MPTPRLYPAPRAVRIASRLRRRQYRPLLISFALLLLWNALPPVRNIILGFYKVNVRPLLHPLARPKPCLPHTLAPPELTDSEIFPFLAPSDLSGLPGYSKKRPKVGIVSLCDHNVDAICGASVANKKAYAERHGYNVIVDQGIIDPTRPTSWSKLRAMRKYLPDYDFLFYSDADTIIVNFETRLEEVVDYNFDQVLAADRNGLNCGVWLIRNTPWSLWFLDEMWAQEQLVHPNTLRMMFKYEQRAFHYLYQSKVWRRVVQGEPYAKANTVRARTKVVNSCVFNSHPAFYEPGDFIVHLAGLKGVFKCVMFRHYYRDSIRRHLDEYGPMSNDADVPPPTIITCMFGRI